MNEIMGIRVGIVSVLSFSFVLVCLGIYFLSLAYRNIRDIKKQKTTSSN
jgi:hypothetical protein